MTEPVTRKIMEIDAPGLPHIIVRYEGNRRWNKYRIYQVWYNMGNHQRLLSEYEDINSVFCWVKTFSEIFVNNNSDAKVYDINGKEIEFMQVY